MKYLKLYEAFESNILSKTLKYLSKGSKDSFLKEVKQICDEMDFPYSKLSDEYFEYLPFNNALKKIDGDNKIYKFWLNSDGDLINTTLTDGDILKQKYTSGDSIGEDDDYVGVGKVYTRYSELDELEDRSKIIIIFKDRDYKPTLATLFEDSGDYYAIHDDSRQDGGTPDDHDFAEWNEYGEYSWSLRGTDFHKIQLAVHKDSVVEGGKSSLRLIEDWISNEKKDYHGSEAHRNEVNDFFMARIKELRATGLSMDKAKEKGAEQTLTNFNIATPSTVDYYLYNKKYKPEHKKDGNPSSKKYLDGAEFSILFNTSKISNFEPKSKIQSTRKEIKSGAQALRDPEDIRKSNLERRLMEIAKKEFNINTFNELFNKILFDKYILFFNLDDTIKSINQIIKLWENPVDSTENDHMNALKKWYNTLTDTTTPNRTDVNRFFGGEASKASREMGAKLTLQHYGKITEDEINSIVTNTIFNTIKRLYNLRTDLLSKEATKKPNCKLLSNKLQELGQLIINKVKPSTFEDIDDIVIAQEKLNSISRILLSDRYDFKKSHDTIIYWAKGLSGNDDVDRHVLESLLDKLNQMIKLVNKL